MEDPLTVETGDVRVERTRDEPIEARIDAAPGATMMWTVLHHQRIRK